METKLHMTPSVPEFSDLGISPTFLPSSIFHTIVRGMLLNCKSIYAITLFKTLQCLLTIYKIVSKYLILTYEALHALILGYHFTLSLATTLLSTPHPALQSGRTGGNFYVACDCSESFASASALLSVRMLLQKTLIQSGR